MLSTGMPGRPGSAPLRIRTGRAPPAYAGPFRYASIVACQRPRVSSITPSGRTRAAAP